MRIVRAICVFSALSAAAALSVHAEQLIPSIRVNIPYTVTEGTHQLAPGDYTIREISAIGHIFGLFNGDGTQLQMFLAAVPTGTLDPAEKSELTFRTDGHEYVIDQMRIGGMNEGYQFVVPRSFDHPASH